MAFTSRNLLLSTLILLGVQAWLIPLCIQRRPSHLHQATDPANNNKPPTSPRVTIIGAGWGGLSAAQALVEKSPNIHVTIVDASPRPGGLVRDGFTTQSGQRPAEAGQHGFWNNYHNIYRLFEQLTDDPTVHFDIKQSLTDYAEQGQYSPAGLQAVWPIYNQQPTLPTGLAQAVYTRFLYLPLVDRLSAWPLFLALTEFDDSLAAWKRFDAVSFRDLCIRLGVSRRCYQEALEPMVLTGLFAPGSQCSAAAALGMAYFFVLSSQQAFDVQWCRGNIGQVIFEPWCQRLQATGRVEFMSSTKVTQFVLDPQQERITHVQCTSRDGQVQELESDHVILAVGAKALNQFIRTCPELAQFAEFPRFANLRGTSVLATRLFLDRNLTIPYSANACWGFDDGVGMTFFDIKAIHGPNATTVAGAPGSVIEVDYYHASTLLTMSDQAIVEKVKQDLNDILGTKCKAAQVVDAAIVRLPKAVNWYFPGSYQDMPNVHSESLDNLYFCGDIVRTRHGSWSQEKAFVTGIEAVNCILGRPLEDGILAVAPDEAHVWLGKTAISLARSCLGGSTRPDGGPSVVDFLW